MASTYSVHKQVAKEKHDEIYKVDLTNSNVTIIQ